MKFRTSRRKILNLDLTPLIDVIFLLLLFFMISTTFIKDSEIKINLPLVSSKASSSIQTSVEVVVTAKGTIYVDGKSTKLNSVEESIASITKNRKTKSLLIRADGEVKHKVIVSIMDAGKDAGIKKISVATAVEKKHREN